MKEHKIIVDQEHLEVSVADCFKFPRKWLTVYKVFYWIISLLYSVVETSH